jgi:Ribosomal protein L7/L12 C-terminal domain
VVSGFNAVLNECSKGLKIAAIKELRAWLSLSLKDAKDIIDTAWDLSVYNTWEERLTEALLLAPTVSGDIKAQVGDPNGQRVLDQASVHTLMIELVKAQKETNELLKDLLEALTEG